MPVIIFVQPDGRERSVSVADGTTVMQAALTQDVAGIIGECGGSAMCATCHVYVDDTFAGRLPEPDAVEREMLDSTAAERRVNSRLGCQIVVGPELDGLRVVVPDRQV